MKLVIHACETGMEPIQHLCNVPKFSDTRNFAGIHLKFKNRGQILGYFVKNTHKKRGQILGYFVKKKKEKKNGRANSADPDQTAPRPSLGEV